MADFLARLAARSLGQLPSVRPRNPSRFEQDTAPVQERPIDALEVELEPAPRVTRTAPVLPGRDQEDETAVSAPRRSRFKQAAAPAVTTVSEHVRQAPEPDTIVDSLPAAVPAPPAQERAPATLPLERIRSEPEFQEEPLAPRDVERSQMPGLRASVESGPSALSTIHQERVSDTADGRTGNPETAVPPERTRPATSVPADALRVATRVVEPSRDTDVQARSAPAPAAPQVTVSIGRIEVKTAPRSEPVRLAQPPARPQPALSLGEYLARQRKGRR